MMSRSFTRREKILLLVLCLLLLGIVYYHLVYKTTAQAMEKYDTVDLETDLQIEQTKAISIKNMKQEIEENQSKKLGTIASYNNIKNEIAALNDVFASASSYNIDFAQAQSDGMAVRRDISVTFNASSYSAAEKIIKDLYNCEYRCLIRSLAISGDSGINSGQVSVNIEATFFETTNNADTESGLEADTNEGNSEGQTE